MMINNKSSESIIRINQNTSFGDLLVQVNEKLAAPALDLVKFLENQTVFYEKSQSASASPIKLQSSTTNLQYFSEDQSAFHDQSLTFVCYRISKQTLQKCILKTPAKQYATIFTMINELTNQQVLLVSINNSFHLDQFLRIKLKIQTHFSKRNIQIVNIPQSILIPLKSLRTQRDLQLFLQKDFPSQINCSRDPIQLNFPKMISYFCYMYQRKYNAIYNYKHEQCNMNNQENIKHQLDHAILY